MDTLEDKTLLDIYGKPKAAKGLLHKKKAILYYFSASWCQPCKELLPKLRKIYDENCKRKSGLEFIYVPLDNDPEAMMQQFKEKHGKWYSIPFGDPTIEILRLTYGITHIPYVIVVKRDGTIISRNGKKDIDKYGVNVLATWGLVNYH